MRRTARICAAAAVLIVCITAAVSAMPAPEELAVLPYAVQEWADQVRYLDESVKEELLRLEGEHERNLERIMGQEPELWETDEEFAERVAEEQEDERQRHLLASDSAQGIVGQLKRQLERTIDSQAALWLEGEMPAPVCLDILLQSAQEALSAVEREKELLQEQLREQIAAADRQEPELWETDEEFAERILREKREAAAEYEELLSSDESAVGRLQGRFDLLSTLLARGWSAEAEAVEAGEFDRNTRIWPLEVIFIIPSCSEEPVRIPVEVDLSRTEDLRLTIGGFDEAAAGGLLEASARWGVDVFRGEAAVFIESVTIHNPLTDEDFLLPLDLYAAVIPSGGPAAARVLVPMTARGSYTPGGIFNQKTLAFIDSRDITRQPIHSALAGRDLQITPVQEWSDFNDELRSGDYGLVVMLNQGNNLRVDIDALRAHIESGGYAVAHDWGNDPQLLELFEAGRGDGSNADGIRILDTGMIEAFGRNTLDFVSNSYGTHSSSLYPLSGGKSLAGYDDGGAAVILGNGGRSVYLGFVDEAVSDSEAADFFTVLLGAMGVGRAAAQADLLPFGLLGGETIEFGLDNGFPPGFTTDGHQVWLIEEVSGAKELRSGPIGSDQRSRLQGTIEVWGSGLLSFRYHVSSEHGYDYLKFYVNGELVQSWSGETGWSEYRHILSEGTHDLLWIYEKDGSSSDGADAARLQAIRLEPLDDRCLSLENGLPPGFTTTGSREWSVLSYEGFPALQSGNIESNQSTELRGTLEVTQMSEFSFDWKVSSETDFDLLDFYHNDVRMGRWSGRMGWNTFSLLLEPGVHDFTWVYSKDGSDSSGDDAGWIRMLRLAPFDDPQLLSVSLANGFPDNASTYGGAGWQVVDESGQPALQSGDISSNEESVLQMLLEGTAAEQVRFDYRVSSEDGFDYLEFFIDGYRVDRWSGESEWAAGSYPLNPGQEHELKWRYVKDGSDSAGADCGWIRNIVIY
jgi:hypothetical protein